MKLDKEQNPLAPVQFECVDVVGGNIKMLEKSRLMKDVRLRHLNLRSFVLGFGLRRPYIAVTVGTPLSCQAANTDQASVQLEGG